jgi:hypothetical protein
MAIANSSNAVAIGTMDRGHSRQLGERCARYENEESSINRTVPNLQTEQTPYHDVIRVAHRN